jgi:hypothetical protein
MPTTKKWNRFWSIVLSALGALSSPLYSKAHAAESIPCSRNEICGLKNPEDMVRLDGTSWVVASQMGKDPRMPGGFTLLDLKARTARVLTPDVSHPAIETYSSCPSAPVPSDLITHGLDLHRGADGQLQLFAVNHGDRESIEVFDVMLIGDDVRLVWIGCVIVPSDMSANAVTALPEGFAVSSFGVAGDQGMAELMAGHPSGFVSRWSTAAGWRRLSGSDFGGDNGVAASADGQTLYINDWADGTLRILPLGQGAGATIPLGTFHPDNVHLLPGGNLLIAGQIGSARDMLPCMKGPGCPVGSMIVVVDPAQREVVARERVGPSASFGAASTAILYEGRYWLSSFRGDRIRRVNSIRKP